MEFHETHSSDRVLCRFIIYSASYFNNKKIIDRKNLTYYNFFLHNLDKNKKPVLDRFLAKFWCVNWFKIKDSNAFFASVQNLLEEFKCGRPPLPDVLRAVDDPCVVKDLERRENKPSKGWNSDTLGVHRMAWLTQIGARMFSKEVGAADKASPWFATLTPREQDVLAFHQACCDAKELGGVERPSI